MAELVSQVMTGNPVALSEGMTVADAARRMRDRDIGAVVVIGNDHSPCGIVTDRDIVVRTVADGKNPDEETIGDVCSRDLTTVDLSASVEDAVNLMRQKALRRLPVVDRGRPVGIVSLGDLAIERDPGSVLADISAAKGNT